MPREFRIFRRNKLPVAYASWARLGEEAAARLRNGARRLKPGDWKSGDELWLVDLVAPFGGRDAITAELRDKVFQGKKVKTFAPGPDGKGLVAVEW